MKKRNRKMRKALLMVLCALTLVAISVGATIAYLTDTEAVTNTFSVGKVDIKMDEGLVYVDADKDADPSVTEDQLGKHKDEDGTRVTANAYRLIPGKTYDKDPKVYVMANSENSYIYVVVDNQIAEIEAAGDGTIAAQIEDKEWTALTDENDQQVKVGDALVYFKEHEKKANQVTYDVFDTFTIDGAVDNAELAEYEGQQVVLTAYAIQSEGFKDEYEAWEAGVAQTWTAYEPNP